MAATLLVSSAMAPALANGKTAAAASEPNRCLDVVLNVLVSVCGQGVAFIFWFFMDSLLWFRSGFIPDSETL
jgi:hypothetical protein